MNCAQCLGNIRCPSDNSKYVDYYVKNVFFCQFGDHITLQYPTHGLDNASVLWIFLTASSILESFNIYVYIYIYIYVLLYICNKW